MGTKSRYLDLELEWYRKRDYSIEEHTCDSCRETFKVPECAPDIEKSFCSVECQENKDKGPPQYECDWCGDVVEGYRKTNFCSPVCSAKAEIDEKYNLESVKIKNSLDFLAKRMVKGKAIIKKECTECKEEFLTPRHSNTKYCSEECMRFSRTKYGIHPYTIFYRDNFRCRYCGKKPIDGAKLTIDHVFPKSKGGGDDLLNLVTACEDCNHNKSITLWDKQRIRKIWKENYKLNKKIKETSYDKMKEEFLHNIDENSSNN